MTTKLDRLVEHLERYPGLSQVEPGVFHWQFVAGERQAIAELLNAAPHLLAIARTIVVGVWLTPGDASAMQGAVRALLEPVE